MRSVALCGPLLCWSVIVVEKTPAVLNTKYFGDFKMCTYSSLWAIEALSGLENMTGERKKQTNKKKVSIISMIILL